MQGSLTVLSRRRQEALSYGHGSEVLERRSCSILITMYEMHGQLIIISVTTATQLNLKYFGSLHKNHSRIFFIYFTQNIEFYFENLNIF
jgi:hypothetical protein